MSIFLLFASLFSQAQAAPCCGGASAIPALITGDEAQNLSASLAMTSVVADADGALSGRLPEFRDNKSAQESKRVLLLNYARLLDGDRLQMGASVPVIQNEIRAAGLNNSEWGLGDVSLILGYEAMPEYEYTLLVPRVFVFTQAIAASSKSIYESLYSADAYGLNQWQAALGAVAVKRWSVADASVSAKLSRVFGRDFDSSVRGVEFTRVGSSWDFMWSLGGGWSPSERIRIGNQLSMEYQSPFETTEDQVSSITSQKMLWTNTLSLTYLSGADDSIVLSYIDQTLFGPAINAALSRGASLAYVHRIER